MYNLSVQTFQIRSLITQDEVLGSIVVSVMDSHSHCGLISYVHDTFRSDEVHIDQITTGWEQLTVEISQNTPGAKNI